MKETTRRDYYEILGVERTATSEDIKKAFRRLAFEHHPDRNKNDGAEERFKEINEAYQVLSDTEKRSTYDRVGHVEGNGFGRGFEGFEFGGMGDIFDAFFGAGTAASRRAPQRGADIKSEMSIAFEDAVFGCERELQVTRMETCGECKGTGGEKGSKPETCSNCGGTGRVQRVERSIFGRFVNVVVCHRCHGDGKVVTRVCPTCNGAGREKHLRRLTVVVPPGVDNGFQLRLSGQGNAGTFGGTAGDLFIHLSVAPHAFFERNGSDVLYVLSINFAQAALGDRVEVPTIDGKAHIDLHPGTQAGEIFRLAGKGAPRAGGGKRGDQLVKMSIMTPTSLDDRQRKLFEELRQSLQPVAEVEAGAEAGAKEGKNIFDRILRGKPG